MLGACDACGLAQKEISATWSRSCSRIYSQYRIYHQAAGKEQKARGALAGTLAPRSRLLTEFVGTAARLAPAGEVLDVGCGNGAFLKAFHGSFGGWRISGAEVNDSFRDDILSIALGARFYASHELNSLDSRFDLVTLIHCLEHIPSPIAYLEGLRHLLGPSSTLLIQVPDAEINPFDLMVADHASHFSKGALHRVVAAAGYEVIDCGNSVLSKEITLLGRPLTATNPIVATTDDGANSFLERNLAWISGLRDVAAELGKEESFGVFGSSIAGTWLCSQANGRVAFFVDEDEDRAGSTNLGVPILRPADVPKGATVFIALEPQLSKSIGDRISRHGFNVILPPGAA
jgi:SAM-dependent methyltransferase